MAKSADTAEGRDAAEASAEFSRLAADMLQNSQSVPLHPLMAHPAAAMAAATAIGFGFSTQMAGAFWGALQGAVEATNKFAAALEQQAKTAPVAGTAAATKADDDKRAAATAVRSEAKAEAAKPAAAETGKAAAPVAANVAAKAPRTATRRKAAAVDDLKLISGIGPKLATVLRERGYGRFADIAAWTEADVARIDAELGFDGRILRDDWVGQAKSLLAPVVPGRK